MSAFEWHILVTELERHRSLLTDESALNNTNIVRKLLLTKLNNGIYPYEKNDLVTKEKIDKLIKENLEKMLHRETPKPVETVIEKKSFWRRLFHG